MSLSIRKHRLKQKKSIYQFNISLNIGKWLATSLPTVKGRALDTEYVDTHIWKCLLLPKDFAERQTAPPLPLLLFSP